MTHIVINCWEIGSTDNIPTEVFSRTFMKNSLILEVLWKMWKGDKTKWYLGGERRFCKHMYLRDSWRRLLRRKTVLYGWHFGTKEWIGGWMDVAIGECAFIHTCILIRFYRNGIIRMGLVLNYLSNPFLCLCGTESRAAVNYQQHNTHVQWLDYIIWFKIQQSVGHFYGIMAG